MKQSIELLTEHTLNSKGQRFLNALASTSPWPVQRSSRYVGSSPVLLLYGAGRPDYYAALQRHWRAGGTSITCDLGYWDRKQGGVRISINGLHPLEQHLELSTLAGKPARRRFVLREDANAAGPVMLVGLGAKTCKQYGFAEGQWERQALARLRSSHPGIEVYWRPKGDRPTRFDGLPLLHGMGIQDALKGCSLVVCRHSNVAIDACEAGVPVLCEDGAARALYQYGENPTQEQRLRFLQQLSWWNWTPNEVKETWRWLLEVMGS